MNWWHRGEERYIEYGTSFGASRAFGIRQSLTDTIYNMNLEHLSKHVETVFERLDDADIRTAGTTYLMYRGRFRHEPSVDTALSRLAHTAFGLPTMGPKELFYADMFASRKTPCRSQLGLPGVRDQHSGCVREYLVENDLFDFLLLSLPDNDTHSHKYGPFAQVDSIAAADRQIARMMEPAGGPEKFLEEHALIVCSRPLAVQGRGRDRPLQGLRRLRPARRPALAARRRDRGLPELARRAGLRARPRQAAHAVPRVERTLLALEGVDLVMRMGDHPDGEAIVRGERSRGVKEVRFAPRGDLVDARGARWSVEGDLDLLGLKIEDDQVPLGDLPGRDEPRLVGAALPDRQARCWPPPARATSSWTGAARTTSAAARTARCTPTTPTPSCCGRGRAPEKSAREQWALRDIVPMITRIAGIPTGEITRRRASKST